LPSAGLLKGGSHHPSHQLVKACLPVLIDFACRENGFQRSSTVARLGCLRDPSHGLEGFE
jgi:hypothetical protein